MVLDLSVLDEVRFDPRASLPSLFVAAFSLSLFGLGGWLWWWRSGLGDGGEVLYKSVVLGTLTGLALWLLWLLATYATLERVLGVPVRVEELLRAMGLATAPLALGLLMVVPFVSFGIGLLAVGGWLLATQVAIERSTPASSAQALVANMAGFAIWVLGMSLLAASDPFAPGPFLAESLFETAG
jgi:hypothetical protein